MIMFSRTVFCFFDIVYLNVLFIRMKINTITLEQSCLDGNERNNDEKVRQEVKEKKKKKIDCRMRKIENTNNLELSIIHLNIIMFKLILFSIVTV